MHGVYSVHMSTKKPANTTMRLDEDVKRFIFDNQRPRESLNETLRRLLRIDRRIRKAS